MTGGKNMSQNTKKIVFMIAIMCASYLLYKVGELSGFIQWFFGKEPASFLQELLHTGIIMLIVLIAVLIIVRIMAECTRITITDNTLEVTIGSGYEEESETSIETEHRCNKAAFDRLIGLEDAKKEVQDFFDIIMTCVNEPELAKRYEIKPPKGLLLYGPPGNGKTAFARACSQYYGFNFMHQKGSEIIAGCTLVGMAESNIKNLFVKARESTPCILFFDEIDAIAQKRSGRSLNSASDLVLNTLLTELDGFDPLNKVFVIAATNIKDILDPALIRPGRLEKHIYIGNPDYDARIGILKAHLGNKPISNDINFQRLATLTEGKSGAFLEAIVNRANTEAFRERREINHHDLEAATKII
jgi:SpoVK/Ycf46/Vps4 family AAA+-type ATPase/uncharacterized membrane protein YhdT